MEVELNPQPVLVPEEATATPQQREAAAKTARKRATRGALRLTAGGSLRTYSSGVAPLFGGELAVRRSTSWGGWATALTVDGGNGTLAEGAYSATTVTAFLGYALGLDRGRWSLWSALGARGGYARLEGTPEFGQPFVPRVQVGGLLGPALRAGGSFTLPGRWLVGLSVEGGVAAVGLAGTVAGERRVELAGAWLGTCVELGFEP